MQIVQTNKQIKLGSTGKKKKRARKRSHLVNIDIDISNIYSCVPASKCVRDNTPPSPRDVDSGTLRGPPWAKITGYGQKGPKLLLNLNPMLWLRKRTFCCSVGGNSCVGPQPGARGATAANTFQILCHKTPQRVWQPQSRSPGRTAAQTRRGKANRYLKIW